MPTREFRGNEIEMRCDSAEEAYKRFENFCKAVSEFMDMNAADTVALLETVDIDTVLGAIAESQMLLEIAMIATEMHHPDFDWDSVEEYDENDDPECYELNS